MEERDTDTKDDDREVQESESERKFDMNIDELQRRKVDKKYKRIKHFILVLIK